jgi:hypothetical protein
LHGGARQRSSDRHALLFDPSNIIIVLVKQKQKQPEAVISNNNNNNNNTRCAHRTQENDNDNNEQHAARQKRTCADSASNSTTRCNRLGTAPRLAFKSTNLDFFYIKNTHIHTHTHDKECFYLLRYDDDEVDAGVVCVGIVDVVGNCDAKR